MKNLKIKSAILIILSILTFSKFGKAQQEPTFNLMVKNLEMGDTLGGNRNVLFFDIYIQHTNLSSSGPFQFALGQYFFYLDPLIANGGLLTYKIVPGSSQFSNLNAIPKNPKVNDYTLALAINSRLSSGNGPIVSSVFPGTRVVKMRLATTAYSLDLDTFDIAYVWSPNQAFTTSVFAYINNENTEITDNGTFLADPVPIPLNLSVAPEQNEINVLKSTDITVSFGVDMNASTINSSNIKVFGSQTGKLSSSVSYDAGTKTATINPNSNFKVGEKIQVTLSNGIQTSSNAPIVPFTWTFTVQALSGTGGFVEASVDTSGTNVSSFVSGDFDNDGDLDIITLNTNSNYLSVYKNDQLGNFTKTSPFPLNVSPKSIIEGDFDSDGDLDIAIAGNNVLYIYKNNANAVFSEYTNIQLTGGNTLTSYADVGDLDKDGDIDIFWGAISGDFIPEPKGFIFLNNGDGSFNYPQSITFGAGFSPCTGGYYTADVKKIEIVDFDNDGDLDVAASAIQGKECIGPSISYPFIAILFNNGNSQFSRAPYISLSSFSPLTTGNFDNDDDADIISKNLLLKNNNNGSFISSSNSINGTSLISSDFDADGDLDIGAANNPNKLFIHKNNGNAEFTQPTDLNLDNNPLALESGDFDGDGDIDIVVLSGSGNFLSILKNNFSATVNLTAFIEGFFDPVSNTQVGDTINLYLGNFASPYQIVDSAKAFLNSSGNAILNFNNAPSGLYYLVFKHRNSIETWSNGGLQLTRGAVVYHDFSWAQYQAYGGNMKLKGTKWCIYSGDIDQDGSIDVSDLSLVYNASKNSASGYLPEDVTGDNFVDVTDLSIVYNNSKNSVIKITPSGTGPQTLINKLNTKKEMNRNDQNKKEINRDDQNKNKGDESKSKEENKK